MKKILLCITLLVLTITLIACEDKEKDILPEPPIVDKPQVEEPVIDEPIVDEEPVIDEPIVDEEPVIDEPIVDEEPVIQDIKLTLINELRTKNVSHTVTLDTTNHNIFTLKMFMTGTYDNPITLKKLVINGEVVNLNSIAGLPSKASDVFKGTFTFNDIVVTAHRVTNYQGLRIKSTSEDPGFITFALDGVNSLELELVFTTSAADYFEKVEIELKK